jgi:hypothetical protein
MLSEGRIAAIGIVSCAMAGCVSPPGMPPDPMLPVTEIVRHATCELRFALLSIQQSNPSFHADKWAIAITLTPTIDDEIDPRLGLTGKSTSSSGAPFFNTWSVGNAPGAEYDMKSHTDGMVDYSFKSSQLLDVQKYPLTCDTNSPNYHALTRYLGIRDWLTRTAAAAEGQLSSLTKIDKPTYNSEITITVDGSGSFTYNYPFGTDFAGLLASYKIDEKVAVAFTPETPQINVRTLPTGAAYSSVNVGNATNVSPAAQSRLDLLSLQQSIRNLESQLGPRR